MVVSILFTTEILIIIITIFTFGFLIWKKFNYVDRDRSLQPNSEVIPLQTTSIKNEINWLSRCQFNVDLKAYNRFRVGGHAAILFQPQTIQELVEFRKYKSPEFPVVVLGLGSNVLVRDGGLPHSILLKLGKNFQFHTIDKLSSRVRVGAAICQIKLAKYCASAGIGGLEFLSGIPGTIGGALRMNSGAHGISIQDVLIASTIVTLNGEIQIIPASEMGFKYRTCGDNLKDSIFIEALFQGNPQPVDTIEMKIKEMLRARDASQPVHARTGGSTFKNPSGQSAWKLIEEAGCRELRIGGAKVSEMHANFLVNDGSATAADIEILGNTIRNRVLKNLGIELDWEIIRIGESLNAEI